MIQNDIEWLKAYVGTGASERQELPGQDTACLAAGGGCSIQRKVISFNRTRLSSGSRRHVCRVAGRLFCMATALTRQILSTSTVGWAADAHVPNSYGPDVSNNSLRAHMPAHSILNVRTLSVRSSSDSTSSLVFCAPPIRNPFLTPVPSRPPLMISIRLMFWSHS